MIIRRIQSENFLKYSNLDLDNLPENGLIAVSGQNESGKTSIGETLCFALFGRTFTLELDDPRKLIRWGESQCSVTVDFSCKENATHQVKRYLDDDGTYGARLTREHDGALLAKGVDRVSDTLRELIGFGYEEFIESFYLAQRELSTPHPHSHTIKVMAGIAPLAEVKGTITSSIQDEEYEQSRASNDYDETLKSLNSLAIDDDWYAQLKESRDNFDNTLNHKKNLIDELQSSTNDYREGIPKYKSKRRAKLLIWFLGGLFFLATIALWGVWGTLEFQAETIEADKINALAMANIPDWNLRYKNWLLPLAILFSTLFLFEIVLLFKTNAELRGLREKITHLAGILDSARMDHQHSSDPAPESVTQLLEALPTSEHNIDANYLDRIKQLENRVSSLIAKPTELTEGEETINVQLQSEIIQLQSQIELLDDTLEEEHGRLTEAAQLGAVRDSLNIKIADYMHRIKVKQVANSLLDSASHHLSHRFNQSILKLAGTALPNFTQGRYQHLKLDENLDVRVFSNEKHDFMGFEEISSGTQRQIMLALRLAMSQELIHAIEAGRQFIFFDEPFAFFDQERIRETLSALPAFSDEVSQIWLVAQEFPDNVDIDLFIPCGRDSESLIIN